MPDPKRDMDNPVNIDLELDDALKVLLGVDEDGEEPEQDDT
jgi:hypothetical protein